MQIHKVHTEIQEMHKYKIKDTQIQKYHYKQSEPDRRRKKRRFSEKVFPRKRP